MEGLRITDVLIENFKNIEKKVVHIGGRSLLVVGGNGKGKSSFIQAVLSPLDSKYLPSKPIRDGEERATVQVKLGGEVNGESKVYTIELYFTPGNQTGRMIMTNEKEETVKTPKTVLKSLLGNIGFDIFEFLQSTPKKQVETLKELAGVDFFEMDKKRKEIYDRRTYLKQKSSDDEAILGSHPYTQEQIEKYMTPIVTTELKEKMGNISQTLEKWMKIDNGVNERKKIIEACLRDTDKALQEIERLIRMIAEQKTIIADIATAKTTADAELEKGAIWLSKNAKPSVAEIKSRLDLAEEHNRHNEAINAYAARSQALYKIKQDADRLSKDIDKIDTEKQDMISKSKLPVPGLSFDDERVYLDKLPMEENQIPKSRLIDIGMCIGMAMNPSLRVMVIQDGSLLDKETLQRVLDTAKEKGYQLLIEMVDEDGGELDVKFTEEIIN